MIAKRSPNPSSRDQELQEQLQQLETKCDRLHLVCTALWALLREQTNLEEEDLLNKISFLEAQQKPTAKPKAELCPECSRPLQRLEGQYHRCIYCGYIQEFDQAFEKLNL